MARRRTSILGLLALVALPGCVSMAPRSREPGPHAHVVAGVMVGRFEDDRCGAASLALVLSAHGDRVSEPDLAASLPEVPGRGVLSVDLLLAARQRGFDAALVAGTPERLRGMTIVKACQEVGIARSTFYYIYAKYPELFAEFQEMIEANEREEFIAILTRRLVILDKIIEDAVSDKTKPRQRLAAYKILMGRLEGLREKVVQGSMDSDEMKELLSGPTLIPGKSRFSPHT